MFRVPGKAASDAASFILFPNHDEQRTLNFSCGRTAFDTMKLFLCLQIYPKDTQGRRLSIGWHNDNTFLHFDHYDSFSLGLR